MITKQETDARVMVLFQRVLSVAIRLWVLNKRARFLVAAAKCFSRMRRVFGSTNLDAKEESMVLYRTMLSVAIKLWVHQRVQVWFDHETLCFWLFLTNFHHKTAVLLHIILYAFSLLQSLISIFNSSYGHVASNQWHWCLSLESFKQALSGQLVEW